MCGYKSLGGGRSRHAFLHQRLVRSKFRSFRSDNEHDINVRLLKSTFQSIAKSESTRDIYIFKKN